MMNNEVFKWDNEACCIPNLLQQLIPFTQTHFNVRTDPAGMAFAGFSAGGFLAADLLADHPEAFGAIGVWSGGLRRFGKVWEPQQYKDLKIHIGAGRYDDAFYTFANPLEEALSLADIDYTSYYPCGGHQWTVWRSLLDDFVTRVFGTPEK